LYLKKKIIGFILIIKFIYLIFIFAELEQLLQNPSQFPGSKEAKELSQKVCCTLKYIFFG